MHTNQTLPEDFVRYARLRGGVFTSSDARAHNVFSPQITAAVRSEQAHRVTPGLYSLSPTLDTTGQLWAGLLHAGPDSALGGASAAYARGEGPVPEIIDIWTGRRTLKDRLNWSLHPGCPTEQDDPHDVDQVFGLLASSRDVDPVDIVERAQRLLALTDRNRMLSLLDPPAVEGLSAAESLFLRNVELRHGLPRPEWHTTPTDQGQHLVARYPRHDVAVVIDAGNVERAVSRWNDTGSHRVSYAGADIVLHLTWRDITQRACRTGYKVAELLWRSGWMGIFPECDGCSPHPFAPPTAPIHALHSHAFEGLR